GSGGPGQPPGVARASPAPSGPAGDRAHGSAVAPRDDRRRVQNRSRARDAARDRRHGVDMTWKDTDMRSLRRRWAALAADPERGDVPGWVMITLITSCLVVLHLARPVECLHQVFELA